MAGVRQEFTLIWANEIGPFPIEVTKLRFPKILHVGDITQLKGSELIPVDVVCGGSPCQGFPDGCTLIPEAFDSSRYKALRNSVAILCVEHVLRGIAYFLWEFKQEKEEF